MIVKSHRESANEARTAAAETALPKVRDRHLRSADAHDAAAEREEKSAANSKLRQADSAERIASGARINGQHRG